LMVVEPVMVTVEAPKTANFCAVPNNRAGQKVLGLCHSLNMHDFNTNSNRRLGPRV
jgi:hypothetical protein